MKGALESLVMMGTLLRSVSLQQSFMVIDMEMAYNVILEKPLLHKISVVISTRYLVLKFPTQDGVATL